VRTQEMDDAEWENGCFEGVVADLRKERCTEVILANKASSVLLPTVLAVLVIGGIAATYAEIVGSNGLGGTTATTEQIIWMVGWTITVGAGATAHAALGAIWSAPQRVDEWAREYRWTIVFQLFALMVSLGMFATVGQMMAVHGNC
jgi:hypothetical protein